MRPFITLTTDFGEGSPYVAEMKGVILSLAPEARLLDVTHSVPPQHIRQGALALAQTTVRFPTDSIHVAVVDPGVGTARRIVYAEIAGRHYVAPDNGLLGLLAQRHAASKVIELTNRSYWGASISSTFHGRDIMAPVAAHLSRGADPADLGPPLPALAPFDWPQPAWEAERGQGEVVAIDGFGNLITNLEQDKLAELLAAWGSTGAMCVSCAGRTIVGLSRTYGDAAAGECIALVGSNDRLEIAVVRGNAHQLLGATLGAPVTVEMRGGPQPQK
jgi:S-adenosylmethionine hydrolase